MIKDRIGVGIIGASPRGSWGTSAHIPALQHLTQFRIAAISTQHLANAHETAARFAVPHAYDDAAALAADPDVDVVAICVRVPEHVRLVRAALAAKKHVLCEWPLAPTTAEAETLAME